MLKQNLSKLLLIVLLFILLLNEVTDLIKKITSIFLVSTLLCNVSTLSVLAQNGNTLLNAEKSTQTKIDKYPPDIPLMHEISFLDGQITPDVHFVGKNNKKGIFVFFYKHFRDLKDLYYKSFENKLNEKWYISDLKEDFLKSANKTYFEKQNRSWWDFDFSWNSIWNSGKSFLGSFNYSKEHHDKVFDLLSSNRHLNRKIRRGDDFRFPGILAVDKNSAEIDDFYLYDDFNSETMQEISSIIKSNDTVQAKLSDLNDLVDRKYEGFRKFKREDTIYDTIAFCYHLNGLNDYLSNFEDDWNHKSLDERKEIRKLRDKINSLVPNYCFLTEKNKAPFANIDVELSKYKVVTDTKDIKKIYVERT